MNGGINDGTNLFLKDHVELSLYNSHCPPSYDRIIYVLINKSFYTKLCKNSLFLDFLHLDSENNEDLDKNGLNRIFDQHKEYMKVLEQHGAYKRLPSDLSGQISSMCVNIIHEAVELQRLTNFKHWKKPEPLHIPKAKEELIDIFHFVLDAAIRLGMTSEDFYDEYMRKNSINIDRQLTGY